MYHLVDKSYTQIIFIIIIKTFFFLQNCLLLIFMHGKVVVLALLNRRKVKGRWPCGVL